MAEVSITRMTAADLLAIEPQASQRMTLGVDTGGLSAEEAGEPVDLDTLFQASWDDHNIRPDAAAHRVHVTLGRLRKMGLKDLITTLDVGWMIPVGIEVDVR